MSDFPCRRLLNGYARPTVVVPLYLSDHNFCVMKGRKYRSENWVPGLDPGIRYFRSAIRKRSDKKLRTRCRPTNTHRQISRNHSFDLHDEGPPLCSATGEGVLGILRRPKQPTKHFHRCVLLGADRTSCCRDKEFRRLPSCSRDTTT